MTMADIPDHLRAAGAEHGRRGRIHAFDGSCLGIDNHDSRLQAFKQRALKCFLLHQFYARTVHIGDVSKYQDGAGNVSRYISNRRGTVGNVKVRTVAAHQDCRVRQFDHGIIVHRPPGRISDTLP